MGRHAICPTSELPPGTRRIVEVEGRSIGIFNVGGTYYALRNRCPHKGAPLCLGRLKGLVLGPSPYQYTVEREGEILRCPWHGWEFDITNGRSYFNPHRVRVKSYDVTVEHVTSPAVPDGTVADPAADEDPSIETYPVTVEQEVVILHV